MEKNWIDVTTIGSPYEEQIEIYSNKRRYRPIKMRALRPFEEKGVGEWQYGSPPNGQGQGVDPAFAK